MHGESIRRVSSLRRPLVSEQPPRSTLVVRPLTVTILGVMFAVVMAWAAAATWYILSTDDVTAQLLRRQATVHATYTEKLAAMRARLDRVASQKLLEQDSLEDRVAHLVSRQVEIETRQAMLFSLGSHIDADDLPQPDPAPDTIVTTGTIPVPARASAFAPVERKPAPAQSVPAKPAPAPDPFQLRLRGEGPGTGRQSRLEAAPSLFAQLGAIELSLGFVEADQFMRLDALNTTIASDAARLREAIIQTGLDPDRLDPLEFADGGEAGVGGPYLPVGLDPEAGPFEAMVGSLQENLIALDRLRRTTEALPFDRPVAERISVSSSFGVRRDPFTRRPAMHSGIDFRARTGTPILATGAGRVTIAEYHGGYGKMVEIDHGNDITTRFAHLSAISVVPGQYVTAGDVIGRAGSTGRSTGPHLHYETRINDKPIDPKRFLQAGRLLSEEFEEEPGE